MHTIVITGPESAGKSTLAADLAQALRAPLVTEFARYYVAHLGRPYQRNDLTTIGRGQRLWMDWTAAQHPDQPYCIVDTDWTVLHVWELFGFERDIVSGALKQPLSSWQQANDLDWQKGYGTPQLPNLYLLCAPDFPWAEDPVREHPHAQQELYQLYEALLAQTGAAVCAVSGPEEQRLAQALERMMNV